MPRLESRAFSTATASRMRPQRGCQTTPEILDGKDGERLRLCAWKVAPIISPLLASAVGYGPHVSASIVWAGDSASSSVMTPFHLSCARWGQSCACVRRLLCASVYLRIKCRGCRAPLCLLMSVSSALCRPGEWTHESIS